MKGLAAVMPTANTSPIGAWPSAMSASDMAPTQARSRSRESLRAMSAQTRTAVVVNPAAEISVSGGLSNTSSAPRVDALVPYAFPQLVNRPSVCAEGRCGPASVRCVRPERG